MKRLLLAATVAAGLAASLPAAAQFQKPEDAVKYRQSGMFLLANHFGRVAAMANGRAPYDAAQATANAELAATLSRLPFAGFVEGTAGSKKGEASSKIWSNRSTFDSGATKMEEAIAKLVAAAKTNSLDQIKPAVGEVGKTCKGCHDEFRNQ
jgi:cytochrome c556